MKNEERLLRAMGNMEDRFLMEAMDYKNKKTGRVRRGIIAAAAAVAVMATSITALAVNESWRDTLRGWFGVGESGASGYTEYEDKSVTLDGMNIQQINELCSGDQLVAYFEVIRTDGEAINLDDGLEAFFAGDEAVWADNMDCFLLETVSQTDDNALLKLIIGFQDMTKVQEVPIYFYRPVDGGVDNISEKSDPLTLDILDTPMLTVEPMISLHSDTADADGTLREVRVCSGSLEVIISHERFEDWCTRVCVPDGGESFCKAYYGSDWKSRGTRREPAYFSMEDELAIAQAFSSIWEDQVTEVLETVTVTMKDGSVLQISGDPVKSYKQYGDTSFDAYTYRYTLLPLVDLDEIASVEVMGQTLEMNLIESAR